ncbi:conserved hypothetical protein [Thermotomaculum hydrothermale]|uniref:Fido domain-containing protein n=1 Tax=Thermotomaculum hydrothermale TaxID=981385 RepID=A0A7R6PMP6_9BACT|nr:Fic family protein [Thermotomaculum hydrothermale]BBB31926.1 conserved hypothetical protein [Thermotomaculum hydrothermale]
MIFERKKLLEDLGGIEEPVVKNKEWLYLLEEETRNSIMIEGFFVDNKELKEVLSRSSNLTRSQKEAFNYFSTAKFVYGLGYQNYRENEFELTIPLIRQINKELGGEGEFRKGSITITGSKIEPPEFNLKEWVQLFVEYVKKSFSLNEEQFISALCVSHAFFEEIHPFEDGNGRTGRILLNYILISKGFPLVIIKGLKSNKEKYYSALEEIDKQHLKLFSEYKTKIPEKEFALKILNDTNPKSLKRIIESSLRESIDRMIIGKLLNKGEKLVPVSELLKQLGYKEGSHRKLIERGKIIAVKEKNTWFSTENIFDMFL